MKTNNNTTTTNSCLPCDIPPLCRNHYFTGKLLTERDFTAEQKYASDKLRLHHLALHGWGVVCGLKVTPHPYCPSLRIVVEPGLAIDACGREVRVQHRKELQLPLPSPLAIEDPCPADPASDEFPQEDPASAEEAPDQATIDLYVCVRYQEWGAELTPSPFNECACGSQSTQPNRICEGYDFEVFTEEPQSFKRVREEKEMWDSEDSKAIYRSMLDGCPKPHDIEWIPLAVIHDFIPGQEVKEDSIDNRIRRRVPSTTTLDRLIECILRKFSTDTLTKITEINWRHRGDYQPNEFMRQFIGESESSPGFVVTFERPVRNDGISERIFQAIAIRYVENTHGAGVPEVVPATVRLNHSRDRVHLHVNPIYARNRLEKIRFDLYLLLRCNLIIDDHGDPVDGELLAGLQDEQYVPMFPTGDGIPGGLFESWIRVGHHTEHNA
jgi:hypothetical protein